MKEILYAVLVLGIMGAVFGAVLAIASKVFAVKTDERLPKLIEALPGANCGGCGFAGCQAYAQAVLEGRAEIGLCVAGGQASADQMAAVMGVTAAKTERVVAMIRCRGPLRRHPRLPLRHVRRRQRPLGLPERLPRLRLVRLGVPL